MQITACYRKQPRTLEQSRKERHGKIDRAGGWACLTGCLSCPEGRGSLVRTHGHRINISQICSCCVAKRHREAGPLAGRSYAKKKRGTFQPQEVPGLGRRTVEMRVDIPCHSSLSAGLQLPSMSPAQFLHRCLFHPARPRQLGIRPTEEDERPQSRRPMPLPACRVRCKQEQQ